MYTKMKYVIILFIVSSIIFSGCADREDILNTEELSSSATKEFVQTEEEKETLKEKKDDETIETGEKELTIQDYSNAIDEKTKSEILKIAKNYYSELGFLKVISIVETTEIKMYHNKGIEDQYDVGNILIFDVLAEMNKDRVKRTISIVKDTETNMWKVINEGF